MKAAVYIRVSTTEQREEGYSIAAQKHDLVRYCEQKGWNITNFYMDEGYSAKNMNRPALQQMLNDIALKHIDIVVIWRLDRLTRDTLDGLNMAINIFRPNGVDFASIHEDLNTSTPDGMLMFTIRLGIAQNEREKIADRVRLGMRQKAREGKKPGGKYPYGYDKEGYLIESEAEVLRELRRLYISERMGFKTIAVTLNRNPANIRRGYDWTSSTVALTLENIFYAGIVRFGGKRPDGTYSQRKKELQVDMIESIGTHETVWTKEEFDEHIALMRGRSDGGYSRKLDYWFTGLLRCGKCGGSMYGRMSMSAIRKDGERIRNPYYWCNNRKANNSCDMPMFRQSHIELLVFEHIKEIVLDPDMTNEARQKDKREQDSKEKEMKRLKREADSIKERIKKWQYMFVNDLLSVEDLRERLNEEYALELNSTRRMEQLFPNNWGKEEVKAKLQYLSDIWTELTDLEKQELLRIIFKEIKLYTEWRGKGRKNAFFPATITPTYH